MNILGIIQARGGSKGVPGKNIKGLKGKPLIAWTIEEAKRSKFITRLIVSTDDEEIAKIACEYGAETPFMRPSEYASDKAKSLGLLQHALNWLKENENYKTDILVQLKPTNPLRTAEHIDKCVEVYKRHNDLDAVITVTKSPAHPLKCWSVEEEYLQPFVPEDVYGINEAAKQPRQSLPEAYVNNSCVHVINPITILKKKSSIGKKVVGVIMDRKEAVNIDDEFDFEIAELLMKKRDKN